MKTEEAVNLQKRLDRKAMKALGLKTMKAYRKWEKKRRQRIRARYKGVYND